jgi:TP901 family phage tail tape measure protein
MSKSVSQWILEMVDKVSAPISRVQSNVESATKASETLGETIDETFGGGNGKKISGLGEQIGKQAFLINQSIDAIGKFKDAFQVLIAPGAEFEAQMADLSAVTQKTGGELAAIGNSAKKLAEEFGGSASQQAEAFKGIIARFGPDIADSDAALGSMGRSVATLSKLMGGDATAAMDALTTAMLQYGVDLSKPIEASEEMARIMNVLVAGGNIGASEVSNTADALKVAGLIAKQSGVGIEGFTSAMQALATGSLFGAEAGTKFRNVLMNMASTSMIPKATVKALKAAGVNMKIVTDSSLSLTDRLRELRKVSGTDLIMQMFGMNSAAAEILMQTADEQDKWTEAITGTNAAIEGANTNMETYNEQVSRTNAWLENLKISFFDIAKPIAPFISLTGNALAGVADLGIAVWGLSILLKKDLWVGILGTIRATGIWIGTNIFAKGATLAVAAATHVWTAAQWLLNAAFIASPIGWIVVGIGAFIAAIALLWNKCEGFRALIMGLWEVLKNFGNIIKNFIIDRITGLLKGIGALGEALVKLFKGDFKGAWQSAQQGVVGIIGADAMKNAFVSGTDAFGKGAAEGIKSFRRSQEEKELDRQSKNVSPIDLYNPGKPVVLTAGTAVNNNAKKRLNDGIGGGSSNGSESKGSGGGKTITMNLTINNHLSGVKNPDEFVNIVVAKINDRIADTLAAVA